MNVFLLNYLFRDEANIMTKYIYRVLLIIYIRTGKRVVNIFRKR
jgi:hypothetical protein